MAGIDKTYINNWDQYLELKNFFESCGTVTDDFGNTFKPIIMLWHNEEADFNEWRNNLIEDIKKNYEKGSYKWEVENGYMTQEEYDNFNPEDHVSIPVMNTPTWFDIWLIRNCPITWIQDNLRSQYGGGWSKTAFTDYNDEDLYEQIKNKVSPYDTFKRNGLGRNIHVNKNSFPILSKKGFKNFSYHFEVTFPDGTTGWYKEDEDYWAHDLECKMTTGWTSSSAHRKFSGKPKVMFRLLQKWDLPAGTTVRVTEFCIGKYSGRRYSSTYKLKIK